MTTLYLLRKPVDRINPSLFHLSESQGDVVFLHQGDANSLSYDALIQKIFEYDHTIVI